MLNKKLLLLEKYNKNYVLSRLNYYNKLNRRTDIGKVAGTLGEMKILKSPKSYNFDTFEYTRYFDGNFKANFLFGDAIIIKPFPTIQKSRPITDDNKNAILLNLDKQRHFVFVKDPVAYTNKKNMLIGRGVVTQPHRIKFMQQYFNNSMCNLGQVNKKGGNPQWLKPKISIAEHLKYKFILSLEGNDVATNLKWIMSSNSVAVMPTPKYETWFMEGTLIADYHYIHIKDDYSDLVEKLTWYLEHEAAALKIIANANAYVKQFFDKQQEDLISLLVLEKYFYYTGQTPGYTFK